MKRKWTNVIDPIFTLVKWTVRLPLMMRRSTEIPEMALLFVGWIPRSGGTMLDEQVEFERFDNLRFNGSALCG